NEFIIETIDTHTDYLKNATSYESSLNFPMLIEKATNEDIHMKGEKPKGDYVRYTVQDMARFFDMKITK
ncbi:hypothetical protein BCV71DRAFT_147311, partial [Rhizopus microsporus]